MISAVTMISDHKIKMKNDETLTEAFNRIYEIFNKSYMTFNNHSDKIKIDQNSVFSLVNTIITKKTIFVLNVIFQIIQLEAINSFLTSIEHL